MGREWIRGNELGDETNWEASPSLCDMWQWSEDTEKGTEGEAFLVANLKLRVYIGYVI